MDEPTASLDPISEREVYRLSEHIFKKRQRYLSRTVSALSVRWMKFLYWIMVSW